MALLGNGGILELSREWPEPMALAFEAINLGTSPRTISLGNEAYWTGDRVWLNFPTGTPFGNGSPGGRGMYFGGIFELSEAKQHVTAVDDEYYQDDNDELFYDNSATTTTTSGYIRVDELGRIRLFTTEIAAYNLITANEIPINLIRTGNFVVARYSNDSIYTTALNQAANSIVPLTLPSDSQLLKSVITPPAGLATIANDPDARGWLIQCDLTDWAMDIDADNLDMTAIGETFGQNTKALVRGAGTLQFQLENQLVSGEQSSMTLLRLVLLTQQASKASAKFYLYKNRTPGAQTIGGNAFYECVLLLNKSKVNVRAGDLITGSADFVATGEIALRFT